MTLRYSAHKDVRRHDIVRYTVNGIQADADKLGDETARYVDRVLDVRQGELCWVVGTVYMEMHLKPNVLDDISKEVCISSIFSFCVLNSIIALDIGPSSTRHLCQPRGRRPNDARRRVWSPPRNRRYPQLALRNRLHSGGPRHRASRRHLPSHCHTIRRPPTPTATLGARRRRTQFLEETAAKARTGWQTRPRLRPFNNRHRRRRP